MVSRLLIAASFGIAVQAMALDARLPKPTDNTIPSPTRDFPSHITVPPNAFELAKRQDVQTVLVGPDNTCGYIDGRPGAAYSCNAFTATCAFVTTSGIGAVACCDNLDCGMRFDCLDYDAIMTSSQCDYGCLQDTFTVKCLNTAYPYCGTVSFFDGVVDYYCDSLSNSVIQSAETTYDGETDGRTFTPVEVTLDTDTATGSDADASTATTRTRARTTNTDDEDSASAGPTDTSAATGSDDSDADSSSSGIPAPAGASGGSSTNTGAIVGGVVGGVGGIALIALLAFFLIRRSKKNKNLQQQQQQQQPSQQPGGYPPMQQQQAPGPQGQGPAPGHQSVYNPAYPPQQQQPYGMQQPQGALPPGYYQDQSKPGGFVTMAPAPAMVPDRNDSTSPVSQMGDNRASLQQQPSSPTSTVHSNFPPSQYGNQPQPQPQQQQQQQSYSSGVPPTVHEAGSNVVGHNNWNDNHHGQFHELPTRE
ncbi:hypothetical protein SLS62_005680 [Diatrype stigma]|uniref:Uncharacterized protein n=1 Tax=Diatrype stigma TaxID=117547 RepID=A0AAN9YSB1_9PEZI